MATTSIRPFGDVISTRSPLTTERLGVVGVDLNVSVRSPAAQRFGAAPAHAFGRIGEWFPCPTIITVSASLCMSAADAASPHHRSRSHAQRIPALRRLDAKPVATRGCSDRPRNRRNGERVVAAVPGRQIMRITVVALAFALLAVPALAQAPDIGRMLQGLTTGNQNQDQALREAYERGYRAGQQGRDPAV
jgi:hypothetical protein